MQEVPPYPSLLKQPKLHLICIAVLLFQKFLNNCSWLPLVLWSQDMDLNCPSGVNQVSGACLFSLCALTFLCIKGNLSEGSYVRALLTQIIWLLWLVPSNVHVFLHLHRGCYDGCNSWVCYLASLHMYDGITGKFLLQFVCEFGASHMLLLCHNLCWTPLFTVSGHSCRYWCRRRHDTITLAIHCRGVAWVKSRVTTSNRLLILGTWVMMSSNDI